MISASSEDDNAPLSGAPYLSSDPLIKLYSSYTLILSNSLPNDLGTYVSHFRGTNTGAATDFGARVFITRSNTVSFTPVPAGKYRVCIGNGAASTNSTYLGQVDQDLDTNVVYTIVTRFVPSSGLSTIWVNPTSESDPSGATATDPGNAAAANPFNVFSYAFRQAGGGGSIAYVDNLKIGTSFNDFYAPVISTIPLQSVPMNTAVGPIALTVQDDTTPASSLIVSNSFTNPSLIASVNIDGTDTNRTVTVTPVSGQQGSAVVTLYASDGSYTTSMSFTVKFGAPAITSIPNQIAYSNTPTAAIPFTIVDAEGDSFTLSSNYTNPGLISSIVFGGSGANRTVTITPTPDQVGVSTINVIASDGFNTATQSFTVTFCPVLGSIFADSFTYPDGSLYLSGPSWSWGTSSGTAGQMLVTNGTAQISRLNTEDVNTGSGFANGSPFAPASAVVLYAGFTITFEQLPTSSGNYFAHFKDNGTGFTAKLFANTAGAAAGTFRIGIANTANAPSVQYPRDLSTNTLYLVVARYNVATGESALWVNPVSAASPPALATDNVGSITVSQYGLREDTGMGVMYMDDLKVGTSLADVAAVPALSQTLSKQVYGSDLVLTWGAPLFALQSAPSVDGPWATIPGATSPYTNSITDAQKYFRLKY